MFKPPLEVVVADSLIRKKKPEALMLQFKPKTVAELFGGMAAGAVLVGVAIIVLVLTGAYAFTGFSTINPGIMIATFIAYLIQGFAEELLCRGLLQNYFAEKLSTVTAILLSAVVFIIPHVATIIELEPVVIIISFVNLLLVSVLFSLSMIRFKSLWVPAGIHIGWNFVLSYICGVSVSGGEIMDNLLSFSASSANWLHGGAYGIEAGCIVTVLLIICDLIIYKMSKK